MSVEYDDYLNEHISNVKKGLQWMLDNLGLSQEENSAIEDAMNRNHDTSKYDLAEYEAYDKYFYGQNRSYKVVQDFDYAWLHHIHHNPHHWQYWVLPEDDPAEGFRSFKPLRMPFNYIFEMIADWWSFSWKSGNLFEIFEWYGEHRKKQYIHPETRKFVEDILEKIWNVLVMQETVAGHDISEIERQYWLIWLEQKPEIVIGYDLSPDGDRTGYHEFGHSDTEEDDEHQYGVPEQKKFPLPDADHVKSAIRFFNYVDPKYEKELAAAILEKAEEYGVIFDKDITVGDENRFKKYLPKEKDSQ